MARVFIGIGSNVGDRRAHIEAVRAGLAKLPSTRLVAFSRVYETAPVGPISQGEFLNAAAEVETTLDPQTLLDHLRAMEADEGRQPVDQRVKWGPRSLDLDILFYDQRVIETDTLRVPHPLLHERWFVLKPLADLDAAFVHPVLKRTVGEMLAATEERES